MARKGIDRTLQALPLVCARHPDVCYLIVGDGPYRAELARIAAEAGVSDRVIFAGGVADAALPDHYAAADVFVMPSRSLPDGDTEGFGLVFLEAGACGVPVVAGRDGGVTDAVRDGENGLTVDGDDPAAIAAAVLRLLDDPGLYGRLRAGGGWRGPGGRTGAVGRGSSPRSAAGWSRRRPDRARPPGADAGDRAGARRGPRPAGTLPIRLAGGGHAVYDRAARSPVCGASAHVPKAGGFLP